MDDTTLELDKKYLKKILLAIIAILLVGITIASLITRYVAGNILVADNQREIEAAMYPVLAFLVFVLSLSITYSYGLRDNYMDSFRVRRKYAYYIRKRSILLYSPVFALFGLLAKSAWVVSYYEGQKKDGLEIALFLVVVYLFYTLVIGTAITILACVNKFVYILFFAIQPWIFVVFATYNRIPFTLGLWNTGKTAVLCVAIAVVWYLALLCLKRTFHQIDYIKEEQS